MKFFLGNFYIIVIYMLVIYRDIKKKFVVDFEKFYFNNCIEVYIFLNMSFFILFGFVVVKSNENSML